VDNEPMHVDPDVEGKLLSRMLRVGLLRSVTTKREGPAYSAFREYASRFPAGSRNAEVLRAAVQTLEDRYRNEYFYKNLLANRLLLGRTQRHDSALLMELKTDSSILDALLIGEFATAYEIKTELDSSAKLASQLASYKRIAPQVAVVTHWSLADRYAARVRDSSVGIYAFTERKTLSVVRPMVRDFTRLDRTSMFNTLRRHEYVRLVWRWQGFKPEAPNALVYEHCLRIFRTIPLDVLVQEHSRELRTRTLRAGRGVRDPRLADIRSLCVQLNPTSSHLALLIEWLEERIDVLSVR
jgi:hypothetical protein